VDDGGMSAREANLDRFAAPSDASFAVIITIMVLDLTASLHDGMAGVESARRLPSDGIRDRPTWYSAGLDDGVSVASLPPEPATRQLNP
jgi:hypothetical protein